MKKRLALFASFALAACGQSTVDAAGQSGDAAPAANAAPAAKEDGSCCGSETGGSCCSAKPEGAKAEGAKTDAGCCSSDAAAKTKPAGEKP